MRIEQDFEPLFENMTELEFTALMNLAIGFAQRNNIEIDNQNSEIDQLTSDLEHEEEHREKAEEELRDIRKNLAMKCAELMTLIDEVVDDHPEYDVDDIKHLIEQLIDL